MYFEGPKRIQGYIHYEGIQKAETYSVSKLFLVDIYWVFCDITPKWMSISECHESCMNLDILSFMGMLESLNLDNYGRSNSLGK